MECYFCSDDITEEGLLITTKGVNKHWSCTRCFVRALIKGRADIVHHWGLDEGLYIPEEEPEDE